RIEIEPDSPSVDAGLETNQRVVAVNNKYVNEKFYTLDDVAQEIEESYYDKHYTDITVMSADLWSKLINSPIHISEIVRVSPETVEAVEKPIVETIADDQAETTKVRLIKLERTYGDKQFGFDCKTLKPEMRYVASNVQPNLPAHRAGLRNNDNILEVNGEPIHMLEHEKVIKKIKSKDDQVDLLVVSDVNEYYRIVNSTKKEEVVSAESPKSSHAEVNIDLRVPNYVRYYEVKRDPSYKGLGISLTPSGVISSIEASSPAFKAGLKKDQRFVEIDGVNVKNKTNQDISKLIQGKDSLVIGVVDVDEEVEEAEKEKEYSSASNLPSEVIIGSISSKTGKKIQDNLTLKDD
ncbi:Na(+) H(+) exchange regulatory cofactor NHE-RF3, partial [Brachionus plicatilis]